MKLLLNLTVLVATVGVLHSAPEDQPSRISEDTVKRELAKLHWRHVSYPGPAGIDSRSHVALIRNNWG